MTDIAVWTDAAAKAVLALGSLAIVLVLADAIPATFLTTSPLTAVLTDARPVTIEAWRSGSAVPAPWPCL